MDEKASSQPRPLGAGDHGRRARRNHRSRGAVLVEFAITLPLMLLLVATVIDLWELLRQADLVLMSTRHGARTAAAEAHWVFSDPDQTKPEKACGDIDGDSPVLTAGVALAHNYLVAVGLQSGACVPSGTPQRVCTGSAYSITSQFEKLCEGGFPQQAVRVTAQSLGAARCLVCLPQLLLTRPVRASSVFAAEVDCNSVGEGLTCP
jgi:hypothetical protein